MRRVGLSILKDYKVIFFKSIISESSVQKPHFDLFGYVPAWSQRQRSLK